MCSAIHYWQKFGSTGADGISRECEYIFWMISILLANMIKQAQPDEHLDETISLTPGGVIGGKSTWEPE